MDDFLSMLPPVEAKAEIVPKSRAEIRHADLESLEDSIFQQSAEIVRDVGRFRDIDPAWEEPPPEWIAELGPEAAWSRFRLARAGWMSKKDAPVGIDMAKSVMIGVSKARSGRDKGSTTMNVMLVQMTAPLPAWQEIEVEEK